MNLSTLFVGLIGFLFFHFDFSFGGGFLVDPKPRSYYDYGRRSRLVNNFPCGGDDYNTPTKDVLTPITPFITKVDKTKYITLNLQFFNAQTLTQGDIQFYLCTDPHDLGIRHENCYVLKNLVNSEKIFDKFLVAEQTDLYESGLYNVTVLYPSYSTDIDLKNDNKTCLNSDSFCTIVMRWQLSHAEVIYNCADFYLESGTDSSDILEVSNNTNIDEVSNPVFVDNRTFDGVPQGSCCVKNSKMDDNSGYSLVDIGQQFSCLLFLVLFVLFITIVFVFGPFDVFLLFEL